MPGFKSVLTTGLLISGFVPLYLYLLFVHATHLYLYLEKTARGKFDLIGDFETGFHQLALTVVSLCVISNNQ